MKRDVWGEPGMEKNKEDDLRPIETLRMHRRHERMCQFIELLLGKYGNMTARQLVTAYMDEKWPFASAKPSVDANQLSKLVRKNPNIVAEPKGRLLSYRLREKRGMNQA